MGFESHDRHGLPIALRRTLEGATVKAANLALQETTTADNLGPSTICMVLGHALDLLSDFEKSQINYDLLLPILIDSMFLSKMGLQWGYFLGTMDADIIQVANNTFDWSPRSSTYVQLQRIFSGPLVSSLGSLSRLVSQCIERVREVNILFRMTEDLAAFTRSLGIQWRQNKLSEVDPTEETVYLNRETRKSTLPLLWQVLKSTMFAIVVIQRSLLGRVLGDGNIPATEGWHLIES